MKLLLDEMLSHRLARHFATEGHEFATVQSAGFKGLSNGELLNAAERRGFHALITTDQNIQYQTNFDWQENLSSDHLCIPKQATLCPAAPS